MCKIRIIKKEIVLETESIETAVFQLRFLRNKKFKDEYYYIDIVENNKTQKISAFDNE